MGRKRNQTKSRQMSIYLQPLHDKWGLILTCHPSNIPPYSFYKKSKGDSIHNSGLSWSWSHGSWIYSSLCNQCLSPLKLRIRTPFHGEVYSTQHCSLSTYKADRHDITDKLLKVALNTINQTKPSIHNTIQPK